MQKSIEITTVVKKPVKYLNNKDLLEQVKVSKQQGKMTNKLATMLQLLCGRYAKKGNFANYSYNDDMQAYAMLMIVKTWRSFDENKSSNAFAFYTQCIKNSFIQYLNQEKRHRDLRDNLLLENGLNPSFAMQSRDDDGGMMFSDDYDYARVSYVETPTSKPKLEATPTEEETTPDA